jgi:hypothetical protein
MVQFGKGGTINPNTTPEEILDFFLAFSTGLTSDEAMRIVGLLSANRNTQLIISCCVGASMNIKTNVDKAIKKLNLTLPESVKNGDSISMTFFAIVGHIIMMVPASNLTLTARGLKVKAVYQKSIGGVDDIFKFHSGISTGNKEKRAENILKWNTSLKSFKVANHIDLLASLCPAMVTPKSNFVSRGIKNIWWVLTWPFVTLYNLLFSVVNSTWVVFKSFLRAMAMMMVASLLILALLPRTANTIMCCPRCR